MRKKGILVFLIFTSYLINGQSNYNKIISDATQNLNRKKIDSVAKRMGYKGGDSFKVYVQFAVNPKGEIVDIRARGPHKIFEEEAIRMVKELPKLDPPKNLENGQKMKFTLPVTMVVETDAEKQKRGKKEERKKNKNN